MDGSVVRGHPDRRGTTWVDAPPAVVWPLVSDIGLMPTLSEELHAVEWLDRVTEPALGRRFVGRSKHATFGQWETTCTVVEYEPGVVFAWAVQDPDNPSATWRFRLEPEGRGTRLSQWAQMGPGPSGLSSAIERMPEKEQKIVYVRLKEFEQGMTRNLEAIKQRMEAGR